MDFDIRDDLYEAGKDWEDGEVIYGRAFYIVARNERGEQWAHHSIFRDTAVSWSHVSDSTIVDRRTAECEASADRLLTRIRESGRPIDTRHWTEMEPAYGSLAYQEIDAWGGHRYDELRHAEDHGEIGIGQADRMFFGA